MKFKLTQTQTFLLAGLAVFAIWAYSKGWFAGPNRGYNVDPTKAPDGTTPTAPADDPKYKNLARTFRNAMLENSTSTDIFVRACDSLLNLSDSDLISVSNAYNKMYVNEDYNTLSAVLQQEWVAPWWVIVGENKSEKKRDELLARFQNLGI